MHYSQAAAPAQPFPALPCSGNLLTVCASALGHFPPYPFAQPEVENVRVFEGSFPGWQTRESLKGLNNLEVFQGCRPSPVWALSEVSVISRPAPTPSVHPISALSAFVCHIHSPGLLREQAP